MTKSELVKELAKETGVSVKGTGEMLDAFINVVQKTLKQGKEVNIPGFGKFYVTERAARKGRNPQTGKVIKIPASKRPVFKAGKTFKESV